MYRAVPRINTPIQHVVSLCYVRNLSVCAHHLADTTVRFILHTCALKPAIGHTRRKSAGHVSLPHTTSIQMEIGVWRCAFGLEGCITEGVRVEASAPDRTTG